MNKSSGNGLNRVRWVTWALCLLPLAALADQPAGKSDADPSDSLVAPETSPGNNDAGGRAGHRKSDPTDEQWRDASKILNQYSPKRMAVLGQLPDGPAKQKAKSFIYARYVALTRVQESFPQLYQNGLQRLTIEDNLYDLRRQFAAANPGAKAGLRASLRKQVKDLFENVQDDRQVRITWMKARVVDLQKQHDLDEQNRETVIEQQLKEVIRAGPNALDRDTRHRGNGAPAPAPNSDGASPGEGFQPTTNPQ